VSGISVEQPFDRDGFYTLLGRCRALLAELAYVDAAVAWLNQAQPLANTGPDGESAGAASTWETATVTIGWTHPFTMTVHHGQNAAWPDAEAYFTHVSTELQRFADTAAASTDADLDAVIHSLGGLPLATAGTLTAAAVQIDHNVYEPLVTHVGDDLAPALVRSLGDWEGAAFANFADRFLTPWAGCRENQMFLIGTIADGYGVAGGIVRAGQHALMNTAATIVEAADAQLAARQTRHAGVPLAVTIKVLGTLAVTLVSLMPTPAAPAAAAARTGALALADYAVSAIPERDREDHTVSATTAADLTAHLRDGVTLTLTNVEANLDELAGRLDATASTVRDMPRTKPLVPPRPQIADGPVPVGDFYHYTASRSAT
jgi:hypothetical protein